MVDQVKLWHKLADTLKGLGRPFVIGGDWQVTPEELQNAGLPRLLRAQVIAPHTATNVQSKRKIDYFLVSDELLGKGHTVRAIYDTRLATHAPVELKLGSKKLRAEGFRLARPRQLPAARPTGPQQAQGKVNWENWQTINVLENNVAGYDEELAAKATEEWLAGAEKELLGQFDIPETEQGPFLGMGTPPRMIRGGQGTRFRDVRSEEGLLGHRAAWTSQALHLLTWHGDDIRNKGLDSEEADLIQRHASRARALRKNWQNEVTQIQIGGNTVDDDPSKTQHIEQLCTCINKGLLFLTKLGSRWHRRPPGLVQLAIGKGDHLLNEAANIRDEISRAAEKFARDRRNRELKTARYWARSAPAKLAHRVTKKAESEVKKSASSSKCHQGERTPQEAADKGMREWAQMWLAELSDGAEDILQAIERWYEQERGDDELEEIVLPPITGDRLLRTSKTFNANTGVGVDGLRPRHIVYLSPEARDELARLLNALEQGRRWPRVLRTVIEVARGKKLGGSRLIGVSPTLYRLWAKARYNDIRHIIEQRLNRPYFAAAPGRGATNAAFTHAWEAEAAAANQEETATTLIDFEKYYECISHEELAVGARMIGLPLTVMTMAAHLYLGPRHISVGKMVSNATFPRRSVLAGCTWATLLIRAIMVRPIENLLKKIADEMKGWRTKISMMVYVDDCMISTRGSRSEVQQWHSWVTRLAIAWVNRVLQKNIARNKLHVVAGSKELRKTLRNLLSDTGCKVSGTGEILGIDYAAGGRMAQRAVQCQRRHRANTRKGRIRWWRKLGGNAREITRQGVLPAMSYGAAAVGIPPPPYERHEKDAGDGNWDEGGRLLPNCETRHRRTQRPRLRSYHFTWEPAAGGDR